MRRVLNDFESMLDNMYYKLSKHVGNFRSLCIARGCITNIEVHRANKYLSVSRAIVKSILKNTMNLNYKLINPFLLLIIGLLCCKVYLLTEKLSEMNGVIQTLTEKIPKLKDLQKGNLMKVTDIKRVNDTITHNWINCYLTYFEGVDSCSSGSALNTSADQTMESKLAKTTQFPKIRSTALGILTS